MSGPTALVGPVVPSRSHGRAALLRLSLDAWPSSLAGVALMAVGVTASFAAFASFPTSQAIWIWGALCLLAYGSHALMLWRAPKHRSEHALPIRFARANLLLGAIGGLLWGSLTWIVPTDPQSLPLMAALACGVQLLGTARTPSSMAMLRAISLPGVALTSVGLAWHAHQPLAGVVAAVLMLAIVRHGRQVRLDLIDAVEQRLRLESLSEEVRRQQAMLQAAAQEQAVLNERQRVLRDMHDGVGASLVSALKMIEQGRLTLDETAGVLQECLDDLRLVIDSLEPIEHNVVTLIATLRYRLGGRLERAGIAIEWSMGEIPPLEWMNAPQALDVLRIAQEALANVLKHSNASRVRVSLLLDDEPGAAHVCLSIEDDGIGFDIAPEAGRGLKHMAHRARSIGGELSVSVAGGTSVRLRLPVAVAL